MVAVESAVGLWAAKGPLEINWPGLMQMMGYLAVGILMVLFGIIMRRRKPENWIW